MSEIPPVPEWMVRDLLAIMGPPPRTVHSSPEDMAEQWRKQATLTATMHWRHAYITGMTAGMAIATEVKYMIVTPEEKARFLAGIDQKKED